MRGMGGPTWPALVTGCTGLRFSDGINGALMPALGIFMLLPLKATANTAVWFD